MDGKSVRSMFSNEVKTLLDLYQQFAILVPSNKKQGAAHVGEEGRYVESLIRECIAKYLPKGIEVLTGFIMRPSTKIGQNDKNRKNDNDKHSTQLDIIVYDSEHYPIFQKFDSNVIVPPEGVIGIISVKKTLRDPDIKREIEALYDASKLCQNGVGKKRIRGPFLAIVSMNSAINKVEESNVKWIFDNMATFYKSKTDLLFNDTVGVITSLNEFSIFKTRPGEDGKHAEYIQFIHKQGEEYLGLELILTGLLSVYYDKTRNNIKRPGFTSFDSARKFDGKVGIINTNGL